MSSVSDTPEGLALDDSLEADMEALATRAEVQVELLMVERDKLDARIKRLRDVIKKVRPPEPQQTRQRSGRNGSWEARGVTPSMIKAAEAALGFEDRFTVKELAERAGMSEGGARGVLKGLRDRQYIGKAGTIPVPQGLPPQAFRVMDTNMIEKLREEQAGATS